MRGDESSRPSRCPSDKELAAFSSGRTALMAGDVIAGHVARCRRCQELLEEHEQSVDPMIAGLRDSFNKSPVDEVEVGRVAAQVESIRQSLTSSSAQLSLSESVVKSASAETATQIRCPYCHELSVAGPASASGTVVCPKCGGNFGLAVEEADEVNDHLGTRVAHYELLELLGEGSFGTVWKARDTVLQRLIALKLPKKGRLRGKNVELFLREAQLAAQVRHPGIVHIYEVGIDKDAVYLASEMVEGQSLDVTLARHRYSVTEAAMLCLASAEAVAAAHAAGMVHCDLKPANILLDQAGNPHITDFGLARRSAVDVVVTTEGRMLGTPVYMSPEQASGDGSGVDTRSDIYSLGVILYELLTGAAPFDGDIHILVSKILLDDPLSPRTLNSSLPRDLETICLKCLEKRANKRYQTAECLATDLRLFLDQKPIHARPVTRVERCLRWVRRKPVLASVSVIACLLLVSTIAALGLGHWRTKSSLNIAERNLYFRSITSAQERWLANDPRMAERILDECPSEMRDFEWAYMKHLVITPIRRLHNAGGNLAYHPDGKELATGGGKEPCVKIWDTETDREIRRLTGQGRLLREIDYSRSGTLIASASQFDQALHVWDAASGQNVSVLTGAGQGAERIAFTVDGAGIVSQDHHNFIRVWDLASRKLLHSMHLDVKRIRDIAFSPTATRFAMASGRADTSEISVFDYVTEELIVRVPAFHATIGSMAFSDDGKRLAVGEIRRSIRVWDLEPTLNLVATIAGPVSEECRVTFDASGDRIAGEALDGTIRVWELARGQTLCTLRGHKRPVHQLAFSPNGGQLAAGTGGEEVCIWDVTTEQGSVAFLGGHASAVLNLAVSGDGQSFAACFGDGSVTIWNLGTGRIRQSLSAGTDAILSVDFSPDSRQLATALNDGSVRIYDILSGEESKRFIHSRRTLRCVAYSPDGRLVASSGFDHTVRVWDASTGKVQHTFRLAGRSISCLAFHPNGRWVAAGGTANTVHVLDVISGEVVWSQDGADGTRVWDLAFSPDGNLFAGSRSDGTIRLRNAEDGSLIRKFGDLATRLRVALAFSPNGQRVATATARTAISLWEPSSGLNVLSITRHPSTMGAVTFTPDGQALITGDIDGTVHLWSAARGSSEDNRAADSRPKKPREIVARGRMPRIPILP